MTVREALTEIAGERLCAAGHQNDQRCHGCTAYLVRHEMAYSLAPKVEAALRASAEEMADAYGVIPASGDTFKNIMRRCVTAGVEKLSG